MPNKKNEMLDLKKLLNKIKNGYTLTDKEKEFIKQVLDEDLKEVIEDIEINFYLDILLVAIGEKEFAETIYKKDIDGIEKKAIGTSNTPSIVFKIFGDEEYLKKLILNPKFHFSSEQKEEILEELGDEELIKKFIYDEKLGLNDTHKAVLIENIYGDDLEKLKEIVLDTSLHIESEIKANWILMIEDKKLIERAIKDDSIGIEGIDKVMLIMSIVEGDEKKAKEYLYDENIKLTPEAKAELAITINDLDLIEKLIKDSSIKLNSFNRARLILEMCNGSLEELKKYIFDTSIKLKAESMMILLEPLDFKDASEILRDPKFLEVLDLKDRIIVANMIGDLDYIREQVNSKKTLIEKIDLMNFVNNEDFVYEFLKQNVNESSDFNLLQLIHKIYIPERLEEFKEVIQRKDKSGELLKYLAKNLGDKEFFSKWEEEHTEISHVTELNTKELEENENIKYVIIKGTINEYYSREDYLKIRKAIDEIIEGIPKVKKGDLPSELMTFKTLFKRLSSIRYDNYAVSEEGDYNCVLARTCRNLYGGLIEGTCVCKGYARILEECALCLGFEIVTVGGDLNIDTQEGHAWNQIKIGGKWFNCDLTNYRNLAYENNARNFYEILQSNDEFLDYYEYYFDEYQNLRTCDITIEELLLREYVKLNAHIFGINEIKGDFRNLQGNLKTLYEIIDEKKLDEGKQKDI